jgi:hypothetical protein
MTVGTKAALGQKEITHPGSPSAVRRPRLSHRGKVWTALLGSNLKDGITGFGPTVEAALKDFDLQYLRALRPPEIPATKNGA